MSLYVATSAVLGLLLRVDALSDAEIAQFRTRGCGVTYGACSGKFMYGTVSVTKDTAADTITLVANGIPDHETCDDTVSAGSTCYNDPLTAWFEEQDHNEAMPLNPVVAASTTALPPATVGFAINGVSIFSPYSRPCTDAVVDEAIGFDDCFGHPQETGTYHYHSSPICLDGYAEAYASQTQMLVGVALDGFPIYNEWDADGLQVASSALDDCHGYDPGDGTGYRYIVNDEFPYIIGCFTGTPLGEINAHCDRRRLSAEELERRDADIARVRSASRYRYQQAVQRRLLQRPERPDGPGGATQDGCDEACSGDACGESTTIALCGADTWNVTAQPTAYTFAAPSTSPVAEVTTTSAAPTVRGMAIVAMAMGFALALLI